MKQILISTCNQCPEKIIYTLDSEQFLGPQRLECLRTFRQVAISPLRYPFRSVKIPKWCPLPHGKGKTRIVNIFSCSQCPFRLMAQYFDNNSWYFFPYCSLKCLKFGSKPELAKTGLDDFDPIPAWCPLEEVKE